MADLTLTIGSEIAEKLRVVAHDLGVTPERLAAFALEQHLWRFEDYEWEEMEHSSPAVDAWIADECIRLGDGVPAEQALAEFRKRVEAAVLKRA